MEIEKNKVDFRVLAKPFLALASLIFLFILLSHTSIASSPSQSTPLAGCFIQGYGTPYYFGDGLVAYYEFERNHENLAVKNSNATAVIKMESVHNTTEGRIGNAYYFEGNGDGLTFTPDEFKLDYDGNFTVSFWFKQSAVYLRDGTIDEPIAELPFLGAGDRKFFAITSEDNLSVGSVVFPSGLVSFISSNATVQNETWYHGLVLYNSSHYVRLFLDGEPVGEGMLASPLYPLLEDARIGAEEGLDGTQFNGSIDSFAVWNRTLSESEVKLLYAMQSLTPYPNQNLTVSPQSINDTSNSIITTAVCWYNQTGIKACGVNPEDPGLISYYPFPSWNTSDYASYNNNFVFANTTINFESLVPSSLTSKSGLGIEKSDNVQYTRGSLQGGDGSGVVYENFDPNQGTLEFWVRPNWNGDDGVFHVIVNQDYGTGSYNWALQKRSNNLMSLDIGGVVSELVASDISEWTAGTWYHIVVVWDANAVVEGVDYARLYIDGSETGDRQTAFQRSTATGNIYFGQNFYNTNQFNGVIAGRILNRPLTSTEVTALYASGAGHTDSFTVTPDTVWLGTYSDSDDDAIFQHRGQQATAATTTAVTTALAVGSRSWKDNDRITIWDGTGYKVQGFINGTPSSTNIPIDDGAGGALTNANLVGRSLDFNATRYAQAANNTIHQITTEDIGISAWVRADSDMAGVTVNVILSKYDTTTGFQFYLYDGLIKLYIKDADGDSYAITGITDLRNNKWNHVAAIIDKSNTANCKVYLNGYDDSGTPTGTLADVGSITSTAILELASRNGGAQKFDGQIRDVILSYPADIMAAGEMGASGEILELATKPRDFTTVNHEDAWALYDNAATTAVESTDTGSAPADLTASANTDTFDSQEAFISKNLIADSGKENGGIGGWTAGAAATTLAKNTTTVKFDTRSLKITNGDATQAFARQTITTAAGEGYRFHGWFRSPATPNGASQLVDVDATAALGVTVTQAGATTAATWYEIDFTFEAADTSTTIDLGSGSATNAEIGYWDNVKIQKNLVNKSGMETGNAGDPWIPTGWSNNGLTAGESQQETTNQHSGASAFKYNSCGFNDGVYQANVPFVANKYYTLSFWAKVNTGSIRIMDEDIPQTILVTAAENGDTWKKYSITYKNTGDTAHIIDLYARTAGTIALVDDISLIELDQAAPTTATFTLDYDNTKKIDGRILEGFSFDGDDKIIMTSTPTNVKGVTYWKKNNTDSAWKFHANITGSLYENGISVPANSFQTFVEGKTIGIAKNKYFNGTIDDIALWNKTLTASDVMNLFLAGANGGYILSNSITRYSETIKAGTKICNASTCSGELNTTILTVDSSTPQVSLLSPVDNDHDNSANPSFTFVALDDDLTNCSFYHNASGTWSLNQTDITPYSNNISVNTFALQFSTGDTKSFVWNVECADLANQKSFAGQNFTYTTDLADPIITWNTPKSDNSTKTNSNIPFSVDFNNTNLYAYDLNITNSSGSIIYSNGSVNLPPVYYRLADYLNMSGQYGEQNITSTISLSDSHTTSTIGDYNPKTSDKDLTFSDKTNKMEFKILGDKTEVDSISTEKNVDRYTMTYVFNAKNMGKEKVLAINVSTTNLLYYLSDSEYPAHLVSIDLANKKGNWIDYNQEKIGDDKYTVKIVNDHECQVTITTTKDKLDFSSVGGLNIVTESVQFLYDSIKPRTTVILPTPNQQIRYGHDVVINYSVFDPYLDRVFYRVDGGVEVDVTGLNASFSSYSIGAGVHTINITANDSTGNSNSSFFTINLYEPAPGGAGSGGGDTGEGWDFTIKTRIVNKKSFGSGDMVNVSFNLSNVKPSSLKYYTLQYYLESPSGDKIGNAQETIVVAIPSNTMVYKGLILPQDSTNGLWKAVGFYHPADHLGEVRSDYDSFIVGEEEEDAESVVAGLVNDITPKIREIPAKFVSSIQKNPWMYVIVGGGVFGVLVLVYTIIYTARSLNGGHKRYKKKQ